MQCCCEQCSCNGKVCTRGMGKLCSAVWWDTIEWAQCFAIWKDTKILQEIIIPLVMHGCDHKNYFSQRKTIADNSRTASVYHHGTLLGNGTFLLTYITPNPHTTPTHHTHVCPVEPSFFQRREVSKRDPVKKSVLALLLAESSKQAGNPFLKYSKYNGEVSRSTIHTGTHRYTYM